MSSRVDTPGEEIQDRPSEDVVAIPGDHMSCPAHVGELDLREAREKFVSALLADEVAHLAPNQKHRYPATEDCVNGCVHAFGVGDFKWGKRRRAADELRIPVPVPAIAAAAQVGGQAIQISGPGPMRVVLGDRVAARFPCPRRCRQATGARPPCLRAACLPSRE